jgi:hypothetical protein
MLVIIINKPRADEDVLLRSSELRSRGNKLTAPFCRVVSPGSSGSVLVVICAK